MARAPYQVLVIPFLRTERGIRYALFHRADADMWQWISGGGEDDEKPYDAAKREAFEEGGIVGRELIALDAVASIPVARFVAHTHWDRNLHVIPEHCFAVELNDDRLTLCSEHRCVEWVDYDAAVERLYWDSNRVALWELRRRLEPTSFRYNGNA